MLAWLIAAAVVVLLCYLPAQLLFHRPGHAVTAPLFLLYATLGLALLAVTAMLAMRLGLAPEWSALPLAALAAAAVRRARWQAVPRWGGLPRSAAGFAALLLGALYLAPLLVASARMGTGEFPQVFYCVDSPYYLSQIHSLIRGGSFPPQSLCFAGETFPYHYGTQVMAAMLARLSGLPAHAATFLVLMPLISAGTLAAFRLISGGDGAKLPLWLGLTVLVGATDVRVHKLLPLLAGLAHGDLGSLARVAADAEVLGNQYPLLSTQYGIFATAALLYALARPAATRETAVAAAVPPLTFLVKSSFFVSLALGAGCWYLLRCWRERTWRWLLVPLASASLFFAAKAALFDVGTLLQPRFAPLAYARRVVVPALQAAVPGAGPRAAAALGWVALAAAPLAPLLALTGRRRRLDREPLLLLAAMTLPALAFANAVELVDLRVADALTIMPFNRELLIFVPVALGAAAVMTLGRSWAGLGPPSRAAAVALAACAAFGPLAGRAWATATLCVWPERGHEYVDNRALGEALARVPVAGTVLVTNDLRYPAENFSRDLVQHQLPALFGHQCWAVTYIYERYPDSARRLEVQAALKAGRWSPELDARARREGWTHLVVRRDYPHPADIPLPLLFENGEYRIFSFPRGGAPAAGSG